MTSKYIFRARTGELERDRAFGTAPTASRLWPHAPAELRRQYAHGSIDAETFWSGPRRWLLFDWRGAR